MCSLCIRETRGERPGVPHPRRGACGPPDPLLENVADRDVWRSWRSSARFLLGRVRHTPGVIVDAEATWQTWPGAVDTSWRQVDVRRAQRGTKRRLMELARRNADCGEAEQERLARSRSQGRGATPPARRPGSAGSAAAHRMLRHQQPRRDARRRLHGRLRRRPAEALALPVVRHPRRPWPGRLRDDAAGGGATALARPRLYGARDCACR